MYIKKQNCNWSIGDILKNRLLTAPLPLKSYLHLSPPVAVIINVHGGMPPSSLSLLLFLVISIISIKLEKNIILPKRSKNIHLGQFE